MFEVDILNKNEEAKYEAFLNKCKFSSVQHSLEWRNVICDLGKDDPFFIVAKENDKIVGVLPLYYFKSKFGNLLTTAAWYTLSGIISSEEAHRQEVYRTMLDYSLNLGKELDCTAISIGTSPFLDDEEIYLEHFKPDYMMQNFVQYIRLREIFDENGKIINPEYLTRSNFTRNLKKAQQQPITISDEQTQENIDKSFWIHEKRMKEIGATALPKELFNSILKNLTPKEKGKFLFAFYQDKMIFGSLFMFNKKKMDAFMISMDSDYRKLGASYLVIFNLLKWANKKNISVFDWMSSPRRGDGVYKWKQQWGSHERTFLYLTRILGDISQWKNMSCKELKKAYNFHYLLPFNLKNSHSKFTRKDDVTTFMQSNSKVQ